MEQAISNLAGYPRWECMCDVDDDWYPNYPEDQVKISVLLSGGIKEFARGHQRDLYVILSISGRDDTGMSCQIQIESWEHMITAWNDMIAKAQEICEYAPVNKEFLLTMGLQRW